MAFTASKATSALLVMALLLTGCGGSDSGGGGGGTVAAPTPTGTTGTNTACTLRARQDWAAAQLREWYLFPETLPASLDPAPYATVNDYVDALTASARAQGKDRYFTYVTSIAEEDSYYASGQTAGFGLRLKVDELAARAYVSEVFENAPAFAAGLDRGSEILAIGATEATMRTTADIVSGGGNNAFVDAVGPSTPGTSRTMRVRNPDGTERIVTLTKVNYDLAPVSSRYGARVIDDNGRKVGYINLRTFIGTANAPLRQAFADFRAQGIDEVIVDLRYNGGGTLSTAQLFGNLLGGNRFPSDIFTQTIYRPEKAAEGGAYPFQPQPESISPRKIAFIGMQGTASASELLINAMVPYLHAQVALIGGNTYGKPVGQIGLDRSQCDDRLRVVAFRVANAVGRGDYYNGLASAMEGTCEAADDLNHPLGDRSETMVSTALDFLAGRSCKPISTALAANQVKSLPGATLLISNHPTPIQRELPGVF